MRKYYRAAAAVITALALLTGWVLLSQSRKTAEFIGAEEPEPQQLSEIIMQWPVEQDIPRGLEEVEAVLNEITSERLGVLVQLQPVTGSLAMETNLSISSGEPLDLCVSLYSGLGYLVNAGYLQPLDTLVDEYGRELRSICGVQLAGGYYQGHLYGIPTVYSNGYRQGFICRSDLLEKYQIEVDRERYYSLDEVEVIFEQIKNGEGKDFYISQMPLGVNGFFSSECLWDNLGASAASGVLMLDQDPDKIVNLYETRAFEAYARRMYRWAQKDFFPPDAAYSAGRAQIEKGNCLGLYYEDATEQEGRYAARTGYPMTFIPTREACMMTGSYQNVLWGISATSRNPEKAMAFLNLIYTDAEVMNLLQYGIEGRSYEIVAADQNGTVIRPSGGKNISELPYYNALGIYGNRLNAYVWWPAETTQNESIRRFSERVSRKSPALGYVFDTEPVAALLSGVEEVLERYLGIINTGMVDPDIELPMLREELRRAGMDLVIAENQRQYNTWRKKLRERD